jgi:arylsulfatase A-like enzyme
LLTGQHTGHVYQRALGNISFRPDPEDITIGTLLHAAGYTTAMLGKSGLAAEPPTPPNPLDKGFDYFFGFLSHAEARRYYPEFMWRNRGQVRYPENRGREGQSYSGDLLLKDALGFLEANANRPFFLQLALQQPHMDLAVPDVWKAPFSGKFVETPYRANNLYRGEPQPKATFAGMIAHLDDSLGQVLQKLKTLGIEERTLVFFGSDNGAMDEFGWSESAFNSSGPLRSAKRDLYEGGIRVPMIARWPKTIAPGQVTDHISAFWDFVPTACELAGVAPPRDTDGISFVPTLLGKPERQAKHDYLYWEYVEQGGMQAVRMGNWKALRLMIQIQPPRPIELYDLAKDVAESRDVAREHPDVVARVKQVLRSAHRSNDRFKIEPP